MDAKTPFDFPAYIRRLTASNRLAAAHGFHFSTCSGIDYLEGMLAEFQQTANFVSVSDVCDESTVQVGGGWMKRRLFTTFILARYTFADPDSYAAAIALCRELYRQFLSRLLRDSDDWTNEMLYLNFADIRCTELGGTFLNGCTGLYFLLTMDEPTCLCYDKAEWNAETFDGTLDTSFD